MLMLVLVPGLFRNLPQPTLAAVVIAASLSLADIPGTARLWRQRRTEFCLSIAAFLGVALLGVLPGIAIAVALSILNVFRRAWWPYQAELGRVDGLPGYHDIRSYPDAAAPARPGHLPVRRARCSSPTPRTFRDEIRTPGRTPTRAPRWIVIAAEPITDVDTTAADMLEDLDEALNARGISLVFAELKTVRGKIERYGLTRTIDPQHFFPTIESAVAAFRQRRRKVDCVTLLRSAYAESPGGSTMSGKRHVLTAVAGLATIAAAACSSSSSSSVSSVAGSHVSALATSSAVAKAKDEATACLQKTGTSGLLSSSGRTELVNCLKGLVPADEVTAFKNCLTSAATSDQVWTSAGRTKFTQTSVPNCVNSVS